MTLIIGYEFEEGAGTTVSPTYGTAIGTGHNLGWTTSMPGYGNAIAKLVEENGTVNITFDLPVNSSTWTELSMCFWYNSSHTSASLEHPAAVMYGAGGDFIGLVLNSLGGGAYWGNGSNTDSIANGVGPAASDGWVHVALVVAASGITTLYIDGVNVKSYNSGNTFPDLASISLLGAVWDHDTRAVMDDFRIYDTALSALQVNEVKNTPMGVPEDEAINTLRVGTAPPIKLYLGSAEVPKAYLGTTLVYGTGDDGTNPGGSVPNLSMTPASGNYTVGGTVQVTIHADSQDVATNAVQANFTYPTNRLTFQSTDTSMSPYTTAIQSVEEAGEVKIGVGILAGETTGNQIVGVVTFTATSAGTASLEFTSESGIADRATSSNICQEMTGATYVIA